MMYLHFSAALHMLILLYCAGSIAAQLAGAFYGYSTFDDRLLTALEQWDDNDFASKGVLLTLLAYDNVTQREPSQEASSSLFSRLLGR